MSDLRNPPSAAGDIDPASDDFVTQFDREFARPAPPAPDAAGTVSDDVTPGDQRGDQGVAGPSPNERGRSVLGRVGMRLIRRPYRWVKQPWPDDRVVQVATTIACLVVTTFIMMRILHWDPLSGRADLVNDDTTPTGGDMGSHVWAPAFLRDHLLPNWQLSGWSMDWYGGLPVYRFYMVVPALAIVALDTFLPYGAAFKYVVISGLVALPFCCWAFGRLARFRYPMPELFAFAGLCFALNESYSIYGGNVKSTMAGEFSFSIAISLMVLGWGLLCRGLDEGKYRSWAAIVLALACLSHGIVLIYTIVGAVAIVVSRLVADWWRSSHGDQAARQILRKRTGYAVVVGGLTALLSAFWVLPFLFNHSYMTDMKYGFRPEGPTDSFWDMFFDQFLVLDVIINALAVAGLLFSVVRRNAYGIALGVTGLVAVALVYLTRDSLPVIGLLWNPRVLPLVYLVRYLLMVVGAVELFGLILNTVRNRPAREVPTTGYNSLALGLGGLVVLVIFGWVYQELPFDGTRVVHGQSVYAWGPFRGQAPEGSSGDASGDGWTQYNFRGYEARELYPEYHGVVQTMERIGEDPAHGCGRALWENNGDVADGNGRYGTTMALMLLPFWTDGCIGSMEGLFFEASGSTPYHFLTAAAMSRQSSNPVRELRYVNNNGAVGVQYLQELGVRYVMVHTGPAVDQAAQQPELTLLAESGPWRIYQVADSDIVVPLDVQPVVVNERSGDQRERHLELGTSWFQNPENWPAMPADDGPEEWPRVDVAVDIDQEVPNPQFPAGTVDNPNTPDVVEAPDTRGRQVSIVAPTEPIEAVTLPEITVSNVDIQQQELSFDVSEVGVPVLIKVSYFPNWSVDGAEGPYRIGSNQMVVVPTDTTVRLHYDRSSSDLLFYGLTLAGVLLAVFLRFRGDVQYPTPAGSAAVRRVGGGPGNHPSLPALAAGPALPSGWSRPTGASQSSSLSRSGSELDRLLEDVSRSAPPPPPPPRPLSPELAPAIDSWRTPDAAIPPPPIALGAPPPAPDAERPPPPPTPDAERPPPPPTPDAERPPPPER